MSIFSELDGIREQARRDIVDAADLYDSLDKGPRDEFSRKTNAILVQVIMDSTNIVARRP